jgi:hypothetical protein
VRVILPDANRWVRNQEQKETKETKDGFKHDRQTTGSEGKSADTVLLAPALTRPPKTNPGEQMMR